MWLYSLAIKHSGDIEENPGSKPNSCKCLCRDAHNFIKSSLLRAYISISKIDIICFSETYLDSSISFDDVNLELPGYNLVHADNPANTKRGGVCIYYHNSLALKVIDIQFLNECITLDTIINKNPFLIFAFGDFNAKTTN